MMVAAIDRALGTGWVHDQIRTRVGGDPCDMDLDHRSTGRRQ